MAYPKKAKYTSDELSNARANGFRTKKPKQPKKANPNNVHGYLTRWNEWVKNVKRNASEHKAKAKRRASGGLTDKQQAAKAMRG